MGWSNIQSGRSAGEEGMANKQMLADLQRRDSSEVKCPGVLELFYKKLDRKSVMSALISCVIQ